MDWMIVFAGKHPTYRWYDMFLPTKSYEYKPFVKIQKHDTWSMDMTLAHIIHPMLLQLRNSNRGYFHVDIEDRPDRLIGTIPSVLFESDEFSQEACDWVLGEMIYAFASKLEMEVEMLEGDEMIDALNRIENGFRLFGRYYGNLWE